MYIRILHTLLWLLVYTHTALPKSPPSYVNYLGIEHGLSNNNVTKIYQDRQGFMWFGTYNGLNRYDGYSFKSYKNQPGNVSSLPDNRITDIIQDHQGYIWIASKVGAAVLNRDEETFNRVNLLQGDSPFPDAIASSINQFAILDQTTLFAASEQKGLLLLQKQSNGTASAESIPLIDEGAERYEYNVQGIATDSQDNLWMIIHNHGLCYYDKVDHVVRVKNTHILSGSNMTISGDGDIWISTNHGIYRYNRKENHFKHYSTVNGLSSNNVATLYSGRNDKIWACTDGGGITIIDVNSAKMEYINRSKTTGLKSQTVNAIYEDGLSRTWIGTLRGGINIIDPQKGRFKHVQNVSRYPNDSKNYILSFAQGISDDVWIGTDGGGLIQWNRTTNAFTAYEKSETGNSGLNNNFVASIVQDRNGFVWIGTYGGGINQLNPKTGKFKHYQCTSPSNGYVKPNVWKLFEDSQGRIWASTLNRGEVYRYDDSQDTFISMERGIFDVLTIYEESPRVFWFGSWSTLTRLDLTSGRKQEFQIGTPVRSIHHGGEDILWIATEGGGILKFNTSSNTYRRYTENEGLPSNTILNILEDNSGHLWLSTYNGLSKFNPTNGSFQNYEESDGLQSNQFSYNAALKLSSGEILFGGIRGFNIFHPDSLQQNATQPTIVLTSLNINHTPFNRYTDDPVVELSDLSSIQIAYDDATLSFSFVALEFSFPDKIKYAYFLEGWDKDWNYLDNQRNAHYSNLREGKYILRIKSTNADGIWSNDERTVQVEVLPPWWRTGWAYTAYLLIIGSMVYIVISYDRKQTTLKYKIKLAELESKKERELNDKKIAFFTHIAHEFRNPLTLIVNPLKDMIYGKDKYVDKEDLSHIYNNSRRLLTLVDKLLLFRKAESGLDTLRLVRLDLVKLCHEVFLCFKQHATSRKITYEFVCEPETCEIIADREKIEICLFNLISNAIKFTPEYGRVTLHIAQNEGFAHVLVNDTGCGIPQHSGDRVFNVFYRDYEKNTRNKEGFGIGLFLVKKFAEAHKGAISYQENKPQGTCFTLLLPTAESPFDGSLVFEDIAEHSVFMEEIMAQIQIEHQADHLSQKEEAHASVPQAARLSISNIITDKKNMLIVDDNDEIRHYLTKLFEKDFNIHETACGETALELIKTLEPDIILSDVVMEGMSGIDLCTLIKTDPLLNHIPIILLTASSSQEVKLKGLEGGADDYVTKPFDKDLLMARVSNLIQSRNRLQDYFYKEITLQKNDFKISSEYRDFLKKAIGIVEEHLDDPSFNVKVLADKIGMSHSNLYKRIKSISGKSANEFIRFVRLRKVAQLLIDTDSNINEAAFAAGFNDIKYFRMQFFKLFGMKPSEYKKKYQTLKRTHQLNMR